MAVVRDDRVLALVPGDATRTHGERLPSEIAAALQAAQVSRHEIDLLAVAAGPGGFTGLRIGLATMQGLAMTLNRPVAGVSTLDALAAQVTNRATFIVPWMDAQRGEVFATVIESASRTVLEPPVADTPAVVLDRWKSRLTGHHTVFIGDAVARDADRIDRALPGAFQEQAAGPLAPQIAMLGRRLAEQGHAGPPHALMPVYVRRPDAEIEREKRG